MVQSSRKLDACHDSWAAVTCANRILIGPLFVKQEQLGFRDMCKIVSWSDHYSSSKNNMICFQDLDYEFIKPLWNGPPCLYSLNVKARLIFRSRQALTETPRSDVDTICAELFQGT